MGDGEGECRSYLNVEKSQQKHIAMACNTFRLSESCGYLIMGVVELNDELKKKSAWM